MKYLLYVDLTEDAPTEVRAAFAAKPGAPATMVTYQYLNFCRDERGFYLKGEGRPLFEGSSTDGLTHPTVEPKLPKGLEPTGWTLTDSGALDRPRAGTYRGFLDARGYVSVFEKSNAGRTTVEWTLEVRATDLDAALGLFDAIRGGIKPTEVYRAGTLSARLRQWWQLLWHGRLHPSLNKQ